MSEKMYCTNCGETMNDAAEICIACGVRQGKKIAYCYHCGSEVKPEQELCLQCGVNPKKVRKAPKLPTDVLAKKESGEINLGLATTLGYLIPGLPSLLWYNQKTKGLAMIGISIALFFILPVVSNIAFGVAGAIDARKLGQRVNQGENLEEWTFFWSK